MNDKQPLDEQIKSAIPEWVRELPKSEQDKYIKVFAVMSKIGSNPSRD